MSDKARASSVLDLSRPTPASMRSVYVQLLGEFRLLVAGDELAIREGGRFEQVLLELGLAASRGVSPSALVASGWQDAVATDPRHSLHSLIHDLNSRIKPYLRGQRAVVRTSAGRYALNTSADIGVDVEAFQAAATLGDVAHQIGNRDAARHAYATAASHYAGDLVIGANDRHMSERERLRLLFLETESKLATYLYEGGETQAALIHSMATLRHEPCSEPAHRMVMMCLLRLGRRAEALRQFHICREALRSDFDAEPEEATTGLYDRIRLNLVEF